MIKINPLLLLTVGLWMLAGCASTPTRVDHGPIRAHTFNFIDPGAKPAASFADNRAELQPRLQEAITRSLAAKGLTRVPSGGDVLVGYLIIVSDAVTTQAIDDYFGYGLAAADLQAKAHETFTVGDKNPTPYPAGTLVIDVVDPKTYRLLRRDCVCRPVMRQLPTDQRLARLQEAVDEALKGLRVAN
jgi:hypothetical protein